jgi:hypothetical protein
MATWRAGSAGLARALAVVSMVAGCAGVGPAADGCAAMGMSLPRCQAIVEDARQRLGERPPVTGIAVEPVTQGDRDTLRAQALVAVVRFAFVDGSEARIEVFCGGPNARTLVCTDRPSAT